MFRLKVAANIRNRKWYQSIQRIFYLSVEALLMAFPE